MPQTGTAAPTEYDTTEVDRSTRWPVTVLYMSALFWLLVGTVFALIASIKMHMPDFLGDYAFLTFGRIRSAHLNAVIYGWSSLGTIATLAWLVARLARVPLRGGIALLATAALWNLGVLLGVVQIMAGNMRGSEWLEIPTPIPVLFLAAFVPVIWVSLKTFAQRKIQSTYVSQWYLFGATFWFPAIYVVAYLPVYQGVPQAAMNWWFAHNVLGIWFTPIGLASAYYFIPKIVGRPIYSYYLSLLGFWALALFYNWNGSHHLVGGPVPTWLMTASITASVMMVIPVAAVAINHHMTMKGHFSLLKTSPTLRFIVFGAMSYTGVSLQGSMQALRNVAQITHFTHHTVAHSHMGMYAFFTMTLFGAMYYILPRILRVEWPSAPAIRWHFWLTALGIGIYVVGLTIGGFFQGLALNDPARSFQSITDEMIPYLELRSVAGVLIAIGHVVFAISCVRLLKRAREGLFS
ncbi:MAG: hypothetical protein A2X94_13105 [Bdellovibrionales bacterium GWB1_55_8]|nr:MAG: hypothetical protein A2X94_13105 [Bdellovibrionales bacterium GWB1_55_8]